MQSGRKWETAFLIYLLVLYPSLEFIVIKLLGIQETDWLYIQLLKMTSKSCFPHI